MKVKIKAPFFEIGVKNYIYGDEVLALAQAADRAAVKYDIDVIFLAPYVDIRRVAEHTERLIVFAPYMDTIRPGRGLADVLPEAIQAAGARGVVINHCERPMTLEAIRETIRRANELDLISFACADSIEEAKAIAQLQPDIINPEPTELIGTGLNIGAAMLCALGLGKIQSLDSARRQGEHETVYFPEEERVKLYEKGYERYSRLLKKLVEE